MQRIRLVEHEASAPIRLTAEQVSVLSRTAPGVGIRVAAGDPGACILDPGSQVGVVVLPEAVVEIQPKLPIDRLFFMLGYAMDPRHWRTEPVDFDAAATVLEAVARAFASLVSQATRGGLLHGYMTHDESSVVMRGRLRVEEQIRRRAGVMFPLEVRYDEFTADVLENRLLLAAIERLMRLPLRAESTRRSLREIRAAFHAVTPVEFQPQQLPEVTFTRLNEHYRPAVGLAYLILAGSSLELGSGPATGTCLLLNMNEVFERFVHRALLEALRLNETLFPRGDGRLALDIGKTIRLRPDLSWWSGDRCRFVGDVKYKRLDEDETAREADLYQLLAYTVAADLAAGMLIYAGERVEAAHHVVRFINRRLYVESIDLSEPPQELLGQIDRLAGRVRGLGTGWPDGSGDPVALTGT